MAGLNIASFGRVLLAFAIVSVLGIVLQVDAAGGGPDQKADAMPADPATLATIKGAIALARKSEPAQASDVKESISDPVARKVVEWAILCSNNEIDFQRHVAFISDNPGWPNIGLLRRRAEAALWKERLDPPTVRAYFDKDQPLTAQGKFALARALLLEGDRADAQNLVREAWRYDNFSGDHHRRRPQDADGHAALCGGRRRGLALGQSRRRQRACYRHCPCRGHQKSGRCEGAAGWGTGGSARRHRLYLQPRPMATSRGEGDGSGRTDPVGPRRSDASARPRPVVDRAAVCLPNSARPRRRQDRVSRRERRRRAEPAELSS